MEYVTMTQEEIEDQDYDFDGIYVELPPVTSLSRILAENLLQIDSLPLHLWMYLAYSKKASINEFKSKFNLSDEKYRESLAQLECHNLIEFDEDSQKLVINNGLDFVI